MGAIESQIDRHLSEVEAAEASEEWVVDTVERAFRRNTDRILNALIGYLSHDPSDTVENVRWHLAIGDVWAAAVEWAGSARWEVAAPTFAHILDTAAEYGAGVITDEAADAYRHIVGETERLNDLARTMQRLSADCETPCRDLLVGRVRCQEPVMHMFSRDHMPHRAVVAGRVVTW